MPDMYSDPRMSPLPATDKPMIEMRKMRETYRAGLVGWVNALLTTGLLFMNAVVAAYFPARRAAAVPASVASLRVR